MGHTDSSPAAIDLRSSVGGMFGTILADPPWQFMNRTGKMAPEPRRLMRYPTMKLDEIMGLPVRELAADESHLHLWIPNALLREGLEVMKAWGFTYKSNLVWYKIRKDGGPDGRGVGFYFRNVTELVLFGTRGRIRTNDAGRRQDRPRLRRRDAHLFQKPAEGRRVESHGVHAGSLPQNHSRRKQLAVLVAGSLRPR